MTITTTRIRWLFACVAACIACFVASTNASAAQSHQLPFSPISPIREGSGLESSDFGRSFLKYVIRCAMPDGSKVSIPHDGTSDVYDGWMGLAPEWKHEPLSLSGQRWVSACELAFVNALGEHVFISVRGSHPNLKASVTPDERKSMPFQEAAFYGNLFTEPMIQYVCRGKGGPVMSPSRSKRLCSDPSLDTPGITRCKMVFSGNCSDVCTVEDKTDHYVTHCRGGNEVYDEVVTAFLP
jgi:hypothetical protein